nr:MAG TPA: hypothetical protein [Caudoviricetes sp.]
MGQNRLTHNPSSGRRRYIPAATVSQAGAIPGHNNKPIKYKLNSIKRYGNNKQAGA